MIGRGPTISVEWCILSISQSLLPLQKTLLVVFIQSILDEYSKKPLELETVLLPFLRELNSIQLDTLDTRVYLGATAGLRLLNITDSGIVLEILNIVTGTISKLYFNIF